MTLEQYIGNPMSKSAMFSAVAREAMQNDYVRKYNELMVREHGKVDYQLFIDKKNNKYYAWFKIPSETIEKFYYDVVIEFYTDSDVKEAGQNLFKYNCRFFSNDPAFVYTYAHVFRDNDLFIEGLKPKMSKLAIKKAPTEKNPYNQIGYVKTIYFAYLTMVKKSLNRVDFFSSAASNMSMNYLRTSVQDADSKIRDREEAGKKLSREKKREREAAKEEKESAKHNTAKVNTSNKIATTSSVKKTKKISGVNKSKKI